ncbi:MAG: four helix bundle protein [Oscillospiraceae bacterium]|nr:four helix bundle protein [Oscillospiraceae bacterium]MDD7429617.1 four helix bundle protein [Oscillospiraceae bacterium]MDY2847966.1 four helix bundle protein [Oscillospiraceae bacterium]
MDSYRELKVWQKSMLLVKEVYHLVNLLPKEETYGLSNQIRRAVVSIPSNIAEGHGRNSDREFAYFLAVARGSKYELETQLQICIMLDFFDNETAEYAFQLCDEIGKMLNAFIKKLANR